MKKTKKKIGTPLAWGRGQEGRSGVVGGVMGRWGICLALVLAFWLAGAACCEAGLKIYYIRHAEGGHNVKRDFANVPKEEWPPYVGNANMFTPKGEEQVAAATQKLKEFSFDFIACSPTWRTRNTILPYLKEKGLKAEIWPALSELPSTWHLTRTDLPPPSENPFTGEKINLPEEEKACFNLKENADRHFKASSESKQTASDILASLRQVVNDIKTRWGGSDKSILLVGHYDSGRALLGTFLGEQKKGLVPIANTGIWMIEEQPDGSFKLMMVNGQPWAERK